MKPRWHTLCLAGGMLMLFTALLCLASRHPVNHDELEHCHAAWLIYQGKVPYQDFFEHHPPYFWYILSIFYYVAGESPAVLYWGRGLMLLALCGSLCMLAQLGKEFLHRDAALWAALLLLANEYIRKALFTTRPDGFMVFLLLAGLWFYCKSWRINFPYSGAILAGLCLGGSFLFHPRAGFTILGLALWTCWLLYRQPTLRQAPRVWVWLGCFAVTSWALLALPFLTYGVQRYRFFVYHYSASTLPTFSPLSEYAEMFLHSGMIVFLAMVFVVFLFLKQDFRKRHDFLPFIIIAMVLNIVGTFVTPRPFIQAFIVLLPLLVLAAAGVIAFYGDRLSELEKFVVIMAVLFVNSVQLLVHLSSQGNHVKDHITRITEMNQRIPPTSAYIGSMEHHPLFRHDVSFYWFNHSMQTFRALDPAFQYDFLGDIERVQPHLIERGVFDKLQLDPEGKKRLRTLLERDYQLIPGTSYYERRQPATGVVP